MRRIAIIVVMAVMASMAAKANETETARIWQVAGTELFKIKEFHEGPRTEKHFYMLVDASENGVMTLPRFSQQYGEPAAYANGLVVYCAYMKYDYYKWGAMDLTGAMVVPFVHKNVKSVLKSAEYKNYSMGRACREAVQHATQLHEFMQVKNKLDEYRKARYSEEYDCYKKYQYQYKSYGYINGHYDDGNYNDGYYEGWRHDGYYIHMLKCVVQNNTMAFTDSHYNYLTGFDFKGKGMYSDKYKAIAAEPKHEVAVTLMRLDGYRVYNMPTLKDFRNGEFYYNDYEKYKIGVRTASSLDELVTSMVNLNMDMWYKKDEFETRAEYSARTTPEMCRMAQEYYASAAATLYNELGLARPFALGEYDRENETFLIESAVGNVAMKIPFEKSMEFRKAWEQDGVAIGSAGFGSTDEGVTLTSLTLRNKLSSYRADTSTPYSRYVTGSAESVTSPVIAVVKNPNPIDEQSIEMVLGQHGNRKVTPADVDLDIPGGGSRRSNAFALIIANENYHKLPGVSFARNDGEVLAQYCTKTLGLPEANVRTYYDATYGQMRQALRDMRDIADAYGGEMDLMVYYAGHGAPDDATSRAYLMPVDAAAVSADYCLDRDAMLKEIAAMGARSTLVMFDACFTGAQRTEEAGKMLGEARSVEIEPAELTMPEMGGSITVISATSGRQTAIPDRENSHGLFTYYVLKKLRESGGNVTLGELWSYLDQNVGRRSSVLGKVQRPSVHGARGWEKMSFFE